MRDVKDIPKVIGMKQTLKQIRSGKVAEVILAMDTDDPIRQEILTACKTAHIPVTPCKSKRVLGYENGIERDAAVVAVLKD